MSNPLDAISLLRLLNDLLPRSSSSRLPQPTDAVAVLIHTIHTALQFRLIPGSTPSTSTHPAPAPAQTSHTLVRAVEDDSMSETTAVDREDEDTGEGGSGSGGVEGRLEEGWNSRGEDSYVFEYRHEQSSMVFRIRVGRMGGRVQIDAMAAVRSHLLTRPVYPSPLPISIFARRDFHVHSSDLAA